LWRGFSLCVPPVASLPPIHPSVPPSSPRGRSSPSTSWRCRPPRAPTPSCCAAARRPAPPPSSSARRAPRAPPPAPACAPRAASLSVPAVAATAAASRCNFVAPCKHWQLPCRQLLGMDGSVLQLVRGCGVGATGRCPSSRGPHVRAPARNSPAPIPRTATGHSSSPVVVVFFLVASTERKKSLPRFVIGPSTDVNRGARSLPPRGRHWRGPHRLHGCADASAARL
jgi:hypothetical protein